MLNRIRCLVASVAVVVLLAGAMPVVADTSVTVDPGQTWLGYMNVFDIGGPGYGMGGAGGYIFGSGWGTGDLSAIYAGPTLTISPNTIGDPNPFWYTPSGGPGSVGNKIMDANMYVEPAGSLPGQTVTFSGLVLSSTMLGPVDALGHGWTSVAFIKDFAPDFSSFVSVTVPLNAGPFSISLATINDPARHVQYGFETIGPDVWFTDVGQYGNIQVTAPEPTSLALIALGAVALLGRRSRR